MSWFVSKSVLIAVLFPLVYSKVAEYDDNIYLNNLYRGADDASNNTFEEDLELIKDDINTVGLNVENLAFDLFTQFMKFFNTGKNNDEQKSPKKVIDSPVLVSQINLSEIRQIEDTNGKLPINTIMKRIDSLENLAPKSGNLKHSRNHTIKIRSADVSWKNLPILGYQNYSSVLNPEDNRMESSLNRNQKSKKISNRLSPIMQALQSEEVKKGTYQEKNDSEADVSQNNADEKSKIDDMNEKIFGYVRFLEDILKNLHNLDSDGIIENITDGTANLLKRIPPSLESKLVEEFNQIQKDKKLLVLSKILAEQKQTETKENDDNNEHDLLDEMKQLLFSFFDEALKESLAITKPAHKEKNINTSHNTISSTNLKEMPEALLNVDSVNNVFHSLENNYIRQKRQVDLNKNWENSDSSTDFDGRNNTAASKRVTIPEEIHIDETNRSEIRTGHTEIKEPSHDAEKKCLLYKDGKNIDESSFEVLEKECQKLHSSLGKRKELLQNQIDGNEITDVRHDDKISKDLAEKSNSSNENMAIESSNLGILIMKDFGNIKRQIESAERVLNETKKVLERETFKEDHLQVEINNQKIEMRLLKSMLQVLLEKYFKGPNDQSLYSKTVSQKPTETYNINSNSVPKLNNLRSHSANPNESKVKSVKSYSNGRNIRENLESRASLGNTNDDKKYNSDDKDVLGELVAFSKRFGDEREEKNIDEQFDKIKLKISQLRNQEINKNNNKFDMGQLTKSLENVPQPASKSNDDILDELNNLQNAINKLKPKDNNRLEHDNEGLKMFLEKLINSNQAHRETPNGNFLHGFRSELYKNGYSPNYYPGGYETVNTNIDDNQYLCTVNIEPANKPWMTYNNVKPNCIEKPFQTTETKFENAKPYQRDVVPSTQYFRENSIPTDRIKGSSPPGGYSVNSNSGHSNFGFPHRRIENDPTVLLNKNLVPSDKPKITELPSSNTYAIGNSDAVPSTPIKKYEETPPLTDRDQIQPSTQIKYIPETNFREEIVKLKDEIKNLQSAIDTLNLLGTQDAATLHNLRVEINDLNRMINSLDENDPYVIRHEPTNLSHQNPPSWPTSVMNQPNYDGKAKQIKKREAPLSNEHFPIATSPVDQQNARAALGDNIQDIKNKVQELKSKLDPTTEQSGDSIARSSSSDDGHLYPLQYSQTNPIPATYLLDPKSANGIKDDWFVGIVSKIMDKIIIALPVIFKKLLEFVFGQFTGLAYNDDYGNGYGNGYSTDVQNIINDLGIFGVLPLIALKAFQGLASIINLLRKNKFLKNFLIPAIIIGIVAASLIFLIWWLQPDDTGFMNNAMSDVSNFANSNTENNYGAANNDYVNNHGEYKMYRTNDDKNDFSRYNNTIFKTLTNS